MTASPVRIKVTGRQVRFKFGIPESVLKARSRSGMAAAAARPTGSLLEAILAPFRIAALGYGVGSKAGSVSVSPPRASLPVVIRGHQPQSWFAAAFRKLFQQPRSGFTKGKHRLFVSHPVHTRSLDEGAMHGVQRNSATGTGA